MVSAASRGARIASPASFTSSRSGEAVFKLISTTKSRLGAQRAVRYVARVRPGDRDEPGVETVQLRDGDGAVLTRARAGAPFEENREAADAAFEALELTPEAENLTPEWEDVNEAGEALGRAEARVREVEGEEFVPPGPAPPAAPEAAKMEAALVAHGVAEPDPALALHQALARWRICETGWPTTSPSRRRSAATRTGWLSNWRCATRWRRISRTRAGCCI